MKVEELKEIKEEIVSKKERQKELQFLFFEKEELESNPLVKRYIELCNMNFDNDNNKEFVLLSEDELLSDVIHKHRNIKDTNRIYVYMGTYEYSGGYNKGKGSMDYAVNRDDPRADYSRYIDIENSVWDDLNINISDRDSFEKNNKIVYINDAFFKTQFDEKYLLLRDEFIKSVLFDGEEKAVQKILKKYNSSSK